MIETRWPIPTPFLGERGETSVCAAPPGSAGMVTYFKRFKMEVDLADMASRPPELPPGYRLVAWERLLLAHHAETLYQSFRGSIDAVVFPSLGNRAGCAYLMNEIARKPGFVPEATWLVFRGDECCATVQGVRERTGLGAIQNLGVVPDHRNQGLGGKLLLQALHGFHRTGLNRAFLEVTARNEGAVRLYRRLGFRRRKTLYKAVESLAMLS